MNDTQTSRRKTLTRVFVMALVCFLSLTLLISTASAAVGYGKGVYNKADTTYAGGSGVWTTGNAGSNYLENQWAFYEYQVTGVTTGTVPSFDVAFNHYQTSSGAVFIDAFANFRATLDDNSPDTYDHGPMQGMLLDGVPYPPVSTTYWKSAIGAISLINHPFVGGALQSGSDPLNVPSEEHGFHVSGSALEAAIGGIPNDGKDHTITLFYEAHLAATFVWHGGHESELGNPASPYYAAPGPEVVPAATIYGTDAYAGWTTPFLGVGSATGSSRHFYIENQTAGSNGGLTLPIPTVPAANGTITVIKDTVPNGPQDFSFTTTGGLIPSTFSLDDDADVTLSNSISFTGLAAGTYTVTEGAAEGFSLTSITGASSFDLGTRTATVVLSAGGTATVTFTNTQCAKIRINKVTDPADAVTSFPIVTSWEGTQNIQDTSATYEYESGWLAPGSGFTVGETPPAGWTLTSITCSDGSAASNITLSPGEIVTVTVTNTHKGKIIVEKQTLPDGSLASFEFDPSYGTNFFLTDGNQNDSGWLVPGNYTVDELALTGWDLTGVTKDGDPFTDNTSFALGAGQTITLVYTNTQRGTIVVVKNAKGGNGTFEFSGTGLGLPATFNITTSGTPNGTGSQTYADLVPGEAGGSRSVTELLGSLPSGWIWTGVTVTSSRGTSTISGPSSVDPTAVVSNLGPGDTVTITFENTAPLVTRTQGFWATHLSLSHAVSFGGTVGGHTFSGLGVTDQTIGTHVIDSDCKLMAAFWANVAKTSTGAKRTPLDQARMQLLQQLVAAILNNAAFGSSPTGPISIADAKWAFQYGNVAQVKAAMTAMASFNTQGDSGIFTPGVSANGKEAKDAAAPCLAFWNILP